MKNFPNGFGSWIESYFEIVQAIVIENAKPFPSGIVADRHASQGHGGLYELAEELTDKFEAENEGIAWGLDKDYFEEIQQFLEDNL